MKSSTQNRNFRLLILPFLIAVATTAHAQDQENAPTPPKRPDILHVSPAYIEELKALHNIESPPTVAEIDSPAPQKKEKEDPDNQTVLYGSGSSEVTDVNSEDIMDIISSSKGNTPYPNRKPGHEAAKIEPSAPNLETTPKPSSPEKALVSFSMAAEKIKLDESLQNFLQTYALKLFNENPDLNMEIHAYATPVAGEKHSDVRISLARALEVRSFLIDKNIAPSRLKLQPNGQDQDNSNDDRIDIIFIGVQ